MSGLFEQIYAQVRDFLHELSGPGGPPREAPPAIVECPFCAVAVAEVRAGETEHAVCPRCHRVLRFTHTEVERYDDARLQVRLGSERRGVFGQDQRPTRTLTWRGVGAAGEPFTIEPRDRIVIIEAMRGHHPAGVVAIENLTDGRTSRPVEPEALEIRRVLGSSVTLGLLAVPVLLFSGMAATWAAAGAIAAAAGAVVAAGRVAMVRRRLRARLPAREQKLLTDGSENLAHRRSLLQRLREHQRRASDQAHLNDALLRLRAALLSSGLPHAPERVASVDSALAALARQRGLTQRLLLEYEWGLRGHEVAAATDGALPGPQTAPREGLASADELREVEEANAQLDREIAANEEVAAIVSWAR